MPLELNHAATAGDDMRLFGDILGGAGSIAPMYGIGGGTRTLSEMFMPGKIVPGLVPPTPLPRPGNLYSVT